MRKVKGFKAFIAVLLMIVAIVVAVIYFLDTPVVEEGVEPTVAQKILIAAKEKLGVILAALGVSAVGVIAYCVRAIMRSSTSANTTNTKAISLFEEKISVLQADNTQLRAQCADLRSEVKTLIDKLDIQSGILVDTLLLSDMPSSVREKIANAKAQYDTLNAATKPVGVAEQVSAETVEVETEETTTDVEEAECEPKTAYFG